MKPTIAYLKLSALGLSLTCGCATGESPSAVVEEVCNGAWHDAARLRDIPVKVRLPMTGTNLPVVIFSHGLGGSVEAGERWAEAWTSEGIATIHIQHHGSDTAVLRSGQLRAAANGEQLQARMLDAQFALDQIEAGGSVETCDLGRLDAGHAGIAGHSFGAHTTLAIAGQSFGGEQVGYDPRFKAAVALSPAPPERAGPDGDAKVFGAIAMPTMMITGTEDTVPINSIPAKDRLRPYEALPPGDKYLLVFDGANHAAFSGNWKRRPRMRPEQHVIDGVSGATSLFWRAYLKDDKAAKASLQAYANTLSDRDLFKAK